MRLHALLLAVGVAVAASLMAAAPAAASDASTAQVTTLVNQERTSRGLTALRSDPALDAVAAEWAAHMNATRDFAHSTSQWRSVRVVAAGWPDGSGENIARGYPTAQSVMDGWMGSPGHRENILRSGFGGIGVGHVGEYWVQLFTWSAAAMPSGSKPVITGSAEVGATLTASISGWPAGSSYSYRWLADGTVISGATGKTFTPGLGHSGTRITVEVRITKSGYMPESRTSAATARLESLAVKRVAGDDRFATAAAVSTRYFPSGADTVFLANGLEFPDALSAAPVAARNGSPILLTDAASLPAATATELARLAPDIIVVIGGTGAISDKVMKRLAPYAETVTRVSGADRYATSRAIADYGFATASVAYLATGADFADALAAGPAAGSVGGPVVLEDGTRGAASKQTLSLLTRLGVHDVRIVGGPGAVSNGIQASLRAAGFMVTRLGGADRFATTTLINAAAFGSTPRVFLSNGLDFPDALSAGPVAAAQNVPLYTANSTCVPAATLAAIYTHEPDEVVLLGGTGVLNSGVARLTAC